VKTESPDSLLPGMPDRRPAIWPWLVMPLIALTAFYCLDRLSREAKEREDLAPAPALNVASPTTDPTTGADGNAGTDANAGSDADASAGTDSDTPDSSPAESATADSVTADSGARDSTTAEPR
jgi:hypothetical protein